MAGTWPTALAAIVAHLNGITADAGTDYATETLSVFAWAPGGRQPADKWPYAFVAPAEINVGRGPGMYRELTLDARVRVFLAPVGQSDDMNTLQRRYDAWMTSLMDSWDSAATIDGAADISVEQQFSGLALFDDIDHGWGFDMVLPNIHISQEKTFSA